jgi:predicted RNase H-like nuclease (RuvC/YqgF family)
MSDFEIHPTGTKDRIKELEAKVERYKKWHYNNCRRIEELEDEVINLENVAKERYCKMQARIEADSKFIKTLQENGRELASRIEELESALQEVEDDEFDPYTW